TATISVTEYDPSPNYVLTALTCNDTDSTTTVSTRNASIKVSEGENVTCTFTNTQQLATIIVSKHTVGGNGTFAYTNTGSGFSSGLTLSTTANTASQTFTNMAPGSYSVAETVPSGWDLSSSTCTGANNTPAAFTLAAGGSVTCTFTDTARGTIVVVKNTVGANGSFAFTNTGTGFSSGLTLSTTA